MAIFAEVQYCLWMGHKKSKNVLTLLGMVNKEILIVNR